MIIIAVVKLEEKETTHATQDLLKAGVALVILSWLVLLAWTFLSWRSKKVDRLALGHADGTKVSASVLRRPAQHFDKFSSCFWLWLLLFH